MFQNPVVKLTIFSFIITSFDLVVKISYYLISIYHLRNELRPVDFGRFLVDTIAWLLIQIAYVLFIHKHVEFLIAKEIELNFQQRFPKFLEMDTPQLTRYPTNKSTTCPCPHNRKSSLELFNTVSESVHRLSKIPVKRRGLIERWVEIWRGAEIENEQEEIASSQVNVRNIKDAAQGQSKIPKRVKRQSKGSISLDRFNEGKNVIRDLEDLTQNAEDDYDENIRPTSEYL